jgi:hypothetical protein
MKATYLWLTRLIALAVVLQAAFIAWGTFDVFNAVDDGEAFTAQPEDYNVGQGLHSIFGVMVIPLLALLLLIFSFFVKTSRAVWFALGVVGLVVLQFVLALVSFGVPFIGVLHGINAFLIAGMAGVAGRMVGRGGPPQAPSPAATPPAAAAA